VRYKYCHLAKDNILARWFFYEINHDWPLILPETASFHITRWGYAGLAIGG
jgi:hypothetical protein